MGCAVASCSWEHRHWLTGDCPLSLPSQIFVRLREWLATAQQLADEKLASAFALAGQAEEIAAWEGRLSPLRLPESFCHNDLQCGNVLVTHAAGVSLRLWGRMGCAGQGTHFHPHIASIAVCQTRVSLWRRV